MTHEPRFWREYVKSVNPGMVAQFDDNLDFGFGGETAAYRALQGVSYDHKQAISKAREVCAR